MVARTTDIESVGTGPATSLAGVAARPVSRRVLVRLGIVVAVLAVWQAVVTLGLVSRLVIAAPSGIVQAFIDHYAQFLSALGTTAIQVVIGAVLAMLVGLFIGAAVAASSLLYEAISPILNAAIAVPWIVLYPLFMVWFGLGATSKVAFGFALGVAPVATASAAAFRSVDKRYLTVARAWQASRWQTLRKVLVPASLPGVLAGLRLGLALVIIGVILGQLIGSNSGLGYLISYYRTLLDTGEVYLGIVLALLLAYGGSVVSRFLQRDQRPAETELLT